MREYKTPVSKTVDGLIYLFLGALAVISIAPVVHVIMASFSDPLRLEAHSGLLLRPLGFTWKGYQLALGIPGVLTGYRNTLLIVFFGTLVNLVMTCFAAYITAQRGWWYSRFIMVIVTITMFFSGGLIPTFLVVKNLNLIDSFLALILPNAINVWNMIVLRTGFMTVPDSMHESARLDGANEFTILVRIILPLSKAVLAVILLYYAVGHWNAWFDAMVYMRTRSKYPLQLVLREVLILESTQTTTQQANNVLSTLKSSDLSIYKRLIRYTTIVLATLPVLCFYPFIQKYFVKGVMIGSLKG